jgi:radical SAM superfamily enzyme YgiQ (UPF0313 family)
LRGDLLDEEFLILAKRAGVIFIAFAIDTASLRLQRLTKKNMNLHRLKKNISLARNQGIFCQGFFMMGFPTETEEELKATMNFALNSDVHAINVLMVTAFQGSEIADLAEKHGKQVYNNFDQNYMTRHFSNLTDLPDSTLQKIRSEFLARFWLNPKRLYHFIRDYPCKQRLPHLAQVLCKRFI